MCGIAVLVFFFFKQKTAYEMLISDWSSDVCSSDLDGGPAAGLAITLAPGANALAVTEAVKARVQEIQPYFPEGVEVRYPYQTAPFVEASIGAVVQTIIEAIALVVLVMLLFLQSWRATLIPAIAIPVVLLGTFAIMAAFGFSINMQIGRASCRERVCH